MGCWEASVALSLWFRFQSIIAAAFAFLKRLSLELIDNFWLQVLSKEISFMLVSCSVSFTFSCNPMPCSGCSVFLTWTEFQLKKNPTIKDLLQRDRFACELLFNIPYTPYNFQKLLKNKRIKINNGSKLRNEFVCNRLTISYFYKQPVYKQLALGLQIDKQFSWHRRLSLSNSKNYR